MLQSALGDAACFVGRAMIAQLDGLGITLDAIQDGVLELVPKPFPEVVQAADDDQGRGRALGEVTQQVHGLPESLRIRVLDVEALQLVHAQHEGLVEGGHELAQVLHHLLGVVVVGARHHSAEHLAIIG
ncbi:hypothetical protein [Cystobacter fuscus]|uniref:hypothetical protein n=1 Tax=Cystobacter fuscus TaxID=43 RepID=UPI0037C13ABC